MIKSEESVFLKDRFVMFFYGAGFWVVLFVFGAATIILPWVILFRFNGLRRHLKEIQNEVAALKASPPPEVPIAAQNLDLEQRDIAQESVEKVPDISHVFEVKHAPVVPAPEPQKKSPRSMERAFGGQAFVWLGALALALAGFYMVKYSIEAGLLSPVVRVAMGLVFGLGLLVAGDWVRARPHFANGVRISQALSGSGLADLYGVIFAATKLYALISPTVGFSGLALVSALGVILSLRHGMPIAIMGLLGGFLTPFLIGSTSPSAPLLFGYLYVLLAGLMVVARKQNWSIVAGLAVMGAFVWVMVWMFGGYFMPGDGLWLGLFLMAVSATVVASYPKNEISRSQGEGPKSFFRRLDFGSILMYATLGVSFILMAMSAQMSDFDAMQWGLYGLLCAGGLALAFFDQERYAPVPWFSMALNMGMIFIWDQWHTPMVAWVLGLYALVFVAGAYVLMSRARVPLMWAGLTGAASLGYYLLAYIKLKYMLFVTQTPYFWAWLALIMMGASVFALTRLITQIPREHTQKQPILGVFSLMTTAFLSFALTIELEQHFLSLAFALQVLAIALVSLKVEIIYLRRIAGVLSGVFVLLMLPDLVLSNGFHKMSLVMMHPTFYLGLPFVCFGVSSVCFRREMDGPLVKGMEALALTLFVTTSYYLMRHGFLQKGADMFSPQSFIERGAVTNLFFLIGMASLWLGQYAQRSTLKTGGMILFALGGLRILFFDLISQNPWLSDQEVGTWPLLNALVLPFGLPILWCGYLSRQVSKEWSARLQGAALILFFTFLTFEVRQFYQGNYLNIGFTSAGEIYTYSVVWILLGVGLLMAGTLTQNALTRTASLPILLMAVGKVFLYDASQLTGLWRVLSFLGLGISLLGLSWFYTRFVFKKEI